MHKLEHVVKCHTRVVDVRKSTRLTSYTQKCCRERTMSRKGGKVDLQDPPNRDNCSCDTHSHRCTIVLVCRSRSLQHEMVAPVTTCFVFAIAMKVNVVVYILMSNVRKQCAQ